MGEFKYCLMNRPDGGNGHGGCFALRIPDSYLERYQHLKEQRRLGILGEYFECTAFDCKHPTILEKYKKLYRWKKRAMQRRPD